MSAAGTPQIENAPSITPAYAASTPEISVAIDGSHANIA